MQTSSVVKKDGFWRSLARILGSFGDALDETEATFLERRVSRLEREVRLMQTQRSPASPGPGQHEAARLKLGHVEDS
jgi:hypothetical protein